MSIGVTAMPKPRKMWKMSPAKSPKPSVPDSIKAELTAKARHLIETVLKPRHVQPPEPDAERNYITDIGAKWNRHCFYFSATYACPGPNALAPTFESKFARMEHVGDGTFALSSLRHTGAWQPSRNAASVDECMKSIQDDPWFMP